MTTSTNPSQAPVWLYYPLSCAENDQREIRLHLAIRGYVLTDDEDRLMDVSASHAMVTNEGDGSQTLHRPDGFGVGLPSIARFESARAYAEAIANYLDGTAEQVQAVADPTPMALELVVRREHTVLSAPTYRVTVAETRPMHVIEAFDVRNSHGLAAAADEAMTRLRTMGFRMSGPLAFHGRYATAQIARDGQETATVVLAGDLMQDARSLVRALPAIDTTAGAQEVLRLVAGLMAGAQALKARADAVLHSDARVESAAILDDAMTAVDGDAL